MCDHWPLELAVTGMDCTCSEKAEKAAETCSEE